MKPGSTPVAQSLAMAMPTVGMKLSFHPLTRAPWLGLDGESGGQGGVVPPGTTPPTGTSVSGTSASTTAIPPAAAPTSEPPEPPAWLPGRLAREGKSAKAELLKTLGFTGTEAEAADYLKRLRELEQNAMTDGQKKDARLAVLETENAQFKQWKEDREREDQQVAIRKDREALALAAGVNAGSLKYALVDLEDYINRTEAVQNYIKAGLPVPSQALESFWANMKTASPSFFTAVQTPAQTVPGATPPNPAQTPQTPPTPVDLSKLDAKGRAEYGKKTYGIG